MSISTQPKIFHIHVDATKISEDVLSTLIKEGGFYQSDFNGHPEGHDHFEPTIHLTKKIKTKDQFTESWKTASLLLNDSEFTGYLEGEYIPFDDYIPYKEYQNKPVPFKIKRRRLDGNTNESFRQSEIHITMEKDQSNKQLIDDLLNSGLYGAYIPKKDGTYLVLTMQGYLRDITKLYTTVKAYLSDVGGAVNCTIKEERAIKFLLYGVNSQELPEIADSIEYFNASE